MRRCSESAASHRLESLCHPALFLVPKLRLGTLIGAKLSLANADGPRRILEPLGYRTVFTA